MNYILEIESKNKSDAQKRASEILGIPEDELDFETEGAGLFGMMARKPVVVRVKPKNEPGDEALIKGVLLTQVHKMGIDAEIEDFEVELKKFVEKYPEISGCTVGTNPFITFPLLPSIVIISPSLIISFSVLNTFCS